MTCPVAPAAGPHFGDRRGQQCRLGLGQAVRRGDRVAMIEFFAVGRDHPPQTPRRTALVSGRLSHVFGVAQVFVDLVQHNIGIVHRGKRLRDDRAGLAAVGNRWATAATGLRSTPV